MTLNEWIPLVFVAMIVVIVGVVVWNIGMNHLWWINAAMALIGYGFAYHAIFNGKLFWAAYFVVISTLSSICAILLLR